MRPHVANEIFYDLFRHIHVAAQIAEGHLRFDHPKFVCVPGSVGILRPKCGTEGINLGKRAGERFRFQLSAYSEVGRTGKEILRVIGFSIRAPRRILRIDRSDPEQFSRAFAVAPRNDRRMDVNEAALLEELVDSEREPAPHSKNRAEKI